MKADAKTQAAVVATLNKFGEAYAKRDIDGVLSFLSPDADLVVIGTGADEKRIGLEEAKAQIIRDWSQPDAASIEFGQSLVSAAGSVAWVTADRIEEGEKLKDVVTSRYNCVELYLTPFTPVMASATGPVVSISFYC